MEEASPQCVLETSRFRVMRHRWKDAQGREVQRELLEHPGAVVLLPELEDGRICLIRNHRVAVGKTLIELPAGTRDPEEDPETTAFRELQEETGYQAKKLELLHVFYTAPGIMNEKMYFFHATGLTLGERQLDAGEEIETLLLDWEGIQELFNQRQIEDAKTLVALLWYERLRRNG
ncbi:ADP-ribose pyrophosphatase [Planctomycetales bacterium 10988]|nr:ADP-ribose pyrophosphatase [Planctomycetales bacterium 10988]